MNWQTIDTCPKEEGKAVLVYCAGNRCIYTACYWCDNWQLFGSCIIFDAYYNITHWMPLPLRPL